MPTVRAISSRHSSASSARTLSGATAITTCMRTGQQPGALDRSARPDAEGQGHILLGWYGACRFGTAGAFFGAPLITGYASAAALRADRRYRDQCRDHPRAAGMCCRCQPGWARRLRHRLHAICAKRARVFVNVLEIEQTDPRAALQARAISRTACSRPAESGTLCNARLWHHHVEGGVGER
jgi:hypothetical protein